MLTRGREVSWNGVGPVTGAVGPVGTEPGSGGEDAGRSPPGAAHPVVWFQAEFGAPQLDGG
ncbi:hypothetical protein GCM10009785_22780 [Brooklawnia cerclae]